MIGPTTPKNVSDREFTPNLRCLACEAPYYTGGEAWYRAYRSRLLHLVRSWGRCGTHIDAEDIVQDAFAALTDVLDTVENPPAWLKTVARRRASRGWQELAQVCPGDAGAHLGTTPDRVRWTSLTPMPDIETSMALRAVLRAMTQLPHRQRVALYLHQVEGWSHAEIAEYLGCATATAAVHANRGRIRIVINAGGNASCLGMQAGRDFVVSFGNKITGDMSFRRCVWVWCGCWSGEPQRWWQQCAIDEPPSPTSSPVAEGVTAETIHHVRVGASLVASNLSINDES